MEYRPRTWKDRAAQWLGRRELIPIEGHIYDVKRAEGMESEPGDAWSADNMNDMENRIKEGFNNYSEVTPKMNTVNGSPGISNSISRGDHAHITSTTIRSNNKLNYVTIVDDSFIVVYDNTVKFHIGFGVGAVADMTFIPNINTNSTMDSPNVNIDSGGYLRRSTSSSERYKNSISDIKNKELNPDKILEIPVRQYRFNEGYITDDPNAHKIDQIGIIVEEMEKVYPHAVEYNEDGTPEMWNYKVMIPAMLAVIQKQDKRINDLESRIAKLEGK